MSEPRTERVSTNLEASLRERLRRECATTDRTEAAVLRLALLAYLPAGEKASPKAA